MRPIAIGGLFVSLLASSASGSFVFTYAEAEQIGGVTVFTLWAKFTQPTDTLLSMFNVSPLAGPFHHADLVGGTFAPQFTSDPATDTYLTIGGQPGFSNSTSPDLGWGGAGFSAPGIPAGAGWYNSNPPNLQGRVDPDTLLVRFGQLAFDQPFAANLSGQLAFNTGPGTATQYASWMLFPAPGALTVLAGFAALGQRRRG